MKKFLDFLFNGNFVDCCLVFYWFIRVGWGDNGIVEFFFNEDGKYRPRPDTGLSKGWDMIQ